MRDLMHFHVLTLFPEMILKGCDNSILKRASEKGLISIKAINIRDYTNDKHGKVDDYPYGGGAGMLMQAQPVYDAWKAVSDRVTKENNAGEAIPKLRTVYVTPKGKPFTQDMAKEFAKERDLVLLCGHYEGIDERVLEEIVTDRISIGDYVLTGGELPAMVMIDAISRLVPGVLGSDESAETETFERELLEYPQYSRPVEWHGKKVPEILLSGDHKKIEEWRIKESEKLTREVRPDLYEKYSRNQEALSVLLKQKKENAYLIDGLLQGKVDLLGSQGSAFLGVHKVTKAVMLCADGLEDGKQMLSLVPRDCELFLHNCEELNEIIQKELGLEIGDACYQSVYTQRVSLPVAHKDIRPYPMSALEYAVENYGGEPEREYLKDRIEKKDFFAAYEGDQIVGFSGVHAGGSLGLLFVDPAYRRGSVGSSLASYLVNISLSRGGLPYAHIRVKNEASLKMQEKMGLYVGRKKIFWAYKR